MLLGEWAMVPLPAYIDAWHVRPSLKFDTVPCVRAVQTASGWCSKISTGTPITRPRAMPAVTGGQCGWSVCHFQAS